MSCLTNQLDDDSIGLFQKRSKQGWLRRYFFEKNPGIFRFATAPLEIPQRTSFQPWKLCKIM